jgi:DNA-binding response OmpR family regulator
MRILIVEDTDSIRRMLEALVSARADSIVGVSNGTDGLDRAFEMSPDVVLLDLNLPGLYNGMEVCARLRADPKTRKVPIFIVSAKDDPQTVARVMQAGATRFFPKPFSPREILKAIDEIRRPTVAPTGPPPLARPATPFGSFVPGRPSLTEAPGASLPAQPTLPSQPSPRRPESASKLPAVRETSRPPRSEPPKRT